MKNHPWPRGTLLQVVSRGPMFRSPREAGSFAFSRIDMGSVVLYADCEDTTEPTSRMIQVIHQDTVGWIYRDIAFQLRSS